jgi:hypothetical protein
VHDDPRGKGIHGTREGGHRPPALPDQDLERERPRHEARDGTGQISHLGLAEGGAPQRALTFFHQKLHVAAILLTEALTGFGLQDQEAADLVVEIAGPHLKSVFVAHLSRECNRPDLAHKTMREALDKGGFKHVSVLLTYAERVSEMVTIE